MDLDELYSVSMNTLRDVFMNKTVILRTDIGLEEFSQDGIYFSADMTDYLDGELTIDYIREDDLSLGEKYKGKHRRFFKIVEDGNEFWWSFSWIDKIILKDKNEKVKIDYNEVNQEIQKGDLVRIKDMSNIEDKKVTSVFGIDVISKGVEFVTKLKGKRFIVCDIIDNKILPYFINGKYIEETISTNMVEVIESNYLQNIEQAKEQGKRIAISKLKILDDIKTMEEMISKVNIKDFKKIYAGSLKRIPKELKGVELLLNEWAFNKIKLYKLLGNNLFIQKEIECEKDLTLVEQDRQKLYQAFPGCYDVLYHIENTELLKNKLEHEYNRTWNQFLGKKYLPGDKISKMLDEAFHNDKLNIFYSDIVATNKVKGFVEISIDPIEYLLMSCNVSGWNSCHKIFSMGSDNISYGAWSGGIFSYMCDNVSMIAFRHDNKLYDFKIRNQKIQAHSKNWRQMVWINEKLDCFITSRQYPNKLEEVTKTVREMLEEQIDKKLGNDTWVHTNKKDKIKSVIKDNKQTGCEILHYNDMLHGFDGDMCYKKTIEPKSNIIKVGVNPICPNCGEHLITRHNYPECTHCSNNH